MQLSICIATYNRAKYIGETIDSILPQLGNDVELLIVDGASTDNTEEVVRKYTQIESSIRYVRLPSKGGVDKDYDKAVSLARGEYCWLFTDDDLLKPGAVTAVKKAIIAGHDLVIVNAEVRDRKLRSVLEPKRVCVQEDKVYAPGYIEGLFVDAADYLSFIGAVVIRREVWLSRKREPYFNTDFIHIGVIFQKPFSTTILLVSQPYIIIRAGNSQWSPRSFDSWMLVWPRLLWSFTDISSKAKHKITGQEPWREFNNLILHRCVGGYTIQTYRKHFASLRGNETWKFIAWLIARSPRAVVRGGRYLYRRLSRSV